MLAFALRAAPAPFASYLRLEIRRALRNRRYLVFTVAFPVILYVFYTAILLAASNQPVGGIAWPTYFLVSMAAYGAIGAATNQAAAIAVERRSGWARQLRVTPLSGAEYVAAKLVSAVAVTAPALVLVSAAGIAVNHVELPLASWVQLLVSLALGSVPFAAFGILLGYLLDAESAQGGAVLSFFALAILGGLFAPLEALPSAVATIGRVLPSSHLASLGHAAVAGRLPDPVDVLVIVAYTIAIGGLAAWRYMADERAGRA